MCGFCARKPVYTHLCTCTRRPEDVRCLSLSLSIHLIALRHCLSVTQKLTIFWLTWSATERSGPAYCCPHCGGLQAYVACAQRFIHMLSLKPSSPQACRASSLVREPAHPLQSQSRGCPILSFPGWVTVRGTPPPTAAPMKARRVGRDSASFQWC